MTAESSGRWMFDLNVPPGTWIRHRELLLWEGKTWYQSSWWSPGIDWMT
jgi:hypothetical protein